MSSFVQIAIYIKLYKVNTSRKNYVVLMFNIPNKHAYGIVDDKVNESCEKKIENQ